MRASGEGLENVGCSSGARRVGKGVLGVLESGNGLFEVVTAGNISSPAQSIEALEKWTNRLGLELRVYS